MLKYTFDNFVLSSTNTTAMLASKAAVKEPQSYSPVLIHGPSGCGKTHLLRAAENYATALGMKALYLTASQLADHIVDCINTKSDPTESLTRYKLILIDDLSHVAGEEQTQAEIANIVSKLQQNGICTILACVDPLSSISIIVNYIKKYFICPLIIGIRNPDKALIRQYFKYLCDGMNVSVTEDAVEHMASSFKGNLPLLKGRFTTSLVYSDGKKAIDVDYLDKYFDFKE